MYVSCFSWCLDSLKFRRLPVCNGKPNSHVRSTTSLFCLINLKQIIYSLFFSFFRDRNFNYTTFLNTELKVKIYIFRPHSNPFNLNKNHITKAFFLFMAFWFPHKYMNFDHISGNCIAYTP